MAFAAVRLSADLLLRAVRDEEDVDRFAAFHTLVNDATQGQTCANLLRYHPEITYDDFLLVEDERSGAIVSTVCLIPWQCRYEAISLRVAMLEMVATHPAYRQRGLVRTLIEHFHRLVNERRFDFSMIEGIPYYYRQFGYAYATDHWRLDSLPTWRIPDGPAAAAEPYQLRPATLADIPDLTRLYAEANAPLAFATLRSPAYWHYLLQAAQYPVQMVVEQNSGSAVGYLCLFQATSQGTLRVVESSIPAAAVGWAVLRQLKRSTTGEIQLGWPLTNPLLQLGRSLGSTPLPGDQWLIRLPDVAALLTKLAPVWERRLAASLYRGLTTSLLLNLFRQAFVVDWVAGQVRAVRAVGFVDASMGADGGDLCIPPDAFVRLLFGYRTLEELQDAWPDIVVRPASRHLLQVLFAKEQGYFWLPYLFFG